jgi:hypothetical protein
MFRALTGLVKNMVVAPVALIADVVTFGGVLVDRNETFTESNIVDACDNLDDLIEGE